MLAPSCLAFDGEPESHHCADQQQHEQDGNEPDCFDDQLRPDNEGEETCADCHPGPDEPQDDNDLRGNHRIAANTTKDFFQNLGYGVANFLGNVDTKLGAVLSYLT